MRQEKNRKNSLCAGANGGAKLATWRGWMDIPRMHADGPIPCLTQMGPSFPLPGRQPQTSVAGERCVWLATHDKGRGRGSGRCIHNLPNRLSILKMIHSAVRRMAVSAPDEAWGSDTEYCFDRKDADAIVRTVTYHRIDQCLSAIWYPSREHDAVRKSITNPFPRISSARDLGTLNRLPLEWLQHVISHMDMSTILYCDKSAFRQGRLSTLPANIV